MRKLIKFWVNLVLWDRRLVANQILEFGDLSLVLLLQVLNILLRNLNIRFELKNVDQVLPLISQLLLEIIDLIWGSRVFQFWEHIEEHGVLI